MAAMDDIDAAWLSFCEGVDMNMNGDTLNETENNSLTSEQNPLNVLNVAHFTSRLKPKSHIYHTK